ncbi:transposase [Bradyrhizobium sp. NBAIM01]|nr:transposase [Bradyrhizobium sp. NBAIM01]
MLACRIWRNLSDPALEAAVADRLSFRRFVGLSLHDATPDHSSSGGSGRKSRSTG